VGCSTDEPEEQQGEKANFEANISQNAGKVGATDDAGSVLICLLVLGFAVSLWWSAFLPAFRTNSAAQWSRNPRVAERRVPLPLKEITVFNVAPKMHERFSVLNHFDLKATQPKDGGLAFFRPGEWLNNRFWNQKPRNATLCVWWFCRVRNLALGVGFENDSPSVALIPEYVIDGAIFVFDTLLSRRQIQGQNFDTNPHPLLVDDEIDIVRHNPSLSLNRSKSSEKQPRLEGTYGNQQQTEHPYSPVCPVSSYRHGGKFADSYGMFCIVVALLAAIALGWPIGYCFDRRHTVVGWCLIALFIILDVGGCLSGIIGCLPWNWWTCLHDKQQHSQREDVHSGTIVLQKYLTQLDYCSTVIRMANVLSKDKRIAVVSALAEGSSIRSIERMTGVNRNTIMNLGVRVGKGCTALLDSKMRDLPCRYLQFDEVWGFIGKKERHVRPDDDQQYGDVWTFCASLNATTRLHMRRLTRLTLAFSKKFENFEAAVGLHFAYYNLVKRHGSLRMTPAMAAESNGASGALVT
jgi:hypothetical protein